MGAEFSVTNQSYNEETTEGKVTTKYKGAWTQRFSTATGSISAPSELAYIKLGLNFITGFDYYVAKNFFLGYEFNFGINSNKFKDYEYSVTGATTPASGTSATSTDIHSTSSSTGPSLMNGIRIGYIF